MKPTVSPINSVHIIGKKKSSTVRYKNFQVNFHHFVLGNTIFLMANLYFDLNNLRNLVNGRIH